MKPLSIVGCVLLLTIFAFSDSAPAQPSTPAKQDSAPQKSDSNPFLPSGTVDRGWPFVRGPDFDGHSQEINLADEWPDDGPPVLWTRELGQGYSAIVAFGDRVYTQAQSLSGQFVYCLDADTGETIWEHRYDWAYEPVGVYPGPRSTPTYSNGFVYFASPDGFVGCLAADTGDEEWSLNVVQEYKGVGTEFGYASSPTVIDGLVVLPVGGPSASMVALDAKSGREIWKTGSDSASYTPAFPIEFNGRPLIVGYLQNALVICDRKTGEMVWRTDLSQGYDEHSAWPIYSEPHLWISGPFRSGSQLLTLSLETAPEFHTVWKSRSMSNDVLSSVLVDGHVYGFDIFDVQSKTHRPSRGKFRCIELLTGDEKWEVGTGKPRRENSVRSEDDQQEIGQAGIVVADGKLILLNEIGELILIRASPEAYEELGRASVLGGELVWTPPVLHRGRVYIRNHSRAVCVFVGNPDLLNPDIPVLSVQDIPQSEYRDLATTVLAIEPEYAFDIPTAGWLRNWYLYSLGLIAGSYILALLLSVAAPLACRRRVIPFLAVLFMLVAGGAGTTLLSRQTQEFVFTWPVCLYASFEPLGMTLRWKRSREKQSGSRKLEYSTLVLFLGVGLAYFLLCRRLSLVFEWTFLAGYAGPLPFCRLAARVNQSPGDGLLRPWALRLGCSLAGFTAFYGIGAALLLFRY